MSSGRAFIFGTGIITALGAGWAANRDALNQNRLALTPLRLFSTPHAPPLLVGAVKMHPLAESLPRTHQIAQTAVAQFMNGSAHPPDAVVIGSTTGGLLATENRLKEGATDPCAYRHHSPSTVAETIAKWCGCHGPVLTVSTACSSGAVALKIALELIRSGRARRVLAGGVDSLSRLTYYGFHALQLIDPLGARPLDRDRKGMTVAEGAAFMMLANDIAGQPGPELLGAGLSCDAFHPTAPHPEGRGALAAMKAALIDANLQPKDIDYINLHGTGTKDNDLAEALAIGDLFPHAPPSLSSVKGAMGHTLAAAGAIEGALAVGCVSDNWIPGNAGLKTADTGLKVKPILRAKTASIKTVLSNSLGFGGNNASVVIGHSSKGETRRIAADSSLTILATACITGAGHTDQTLDWLAGGNHCVGRLGSNEVTAFIPKKRVRRLQRLTRLALALAHQAQQRSSSNHFPANIFMGTGWGALTETHRFLTRSFETDEQFPSPTDFIGSVHNAPAGQVAMMLGATGANVATTGGDASFEQALLSAGLICSDKDDIALVMGVDEAHHIFSSLLDGSVRKSKTLTEGGGALLVRPGKTAGEVSIRVTHLELADGLGGTVQRLIAALGGNNRINTRFDFILAGVPAAYAALGGVSGTQDGSHCRRRGKFAHPTAIVYNGSGEVRHFDKPLQLFTAQGNIPGGLTRGTNHKLANQSGLILGLGQWVSAMEVKQS